MIRYTSTDMRSTEIRAVSNPKWALENEDGGDTEDLVLPWIISNLRAYTHRVRVGRHVCARGLINCI